MGERRLLLDSRYRRVNDEPDRYVVELEFPLENVDSLAVVGYNVPFTSPTVADGNDTITVYHQGRRNEVVVAHADYSTPGDLAAALSTALPAPFSASVSSQSGREFLVVQGSDEFKIACPAASARVFGLRPVLPTSAHGVLARAAKGELHSEFDTTSSLHVATFPYPPDLGPEPYLLLHIDGLDGLESPAQGAGGATSVVVDGRADVVHPHYARSDRREISRLGVKFTRPTGEKYTFGGRDHFIELSIKDVP